MMHEHNKQEINEALEHLCAHSLFSNSTTLVRIIKYLVEKAILKEELKEYTIGSDLFGIDYSSDKNNSTVRSYIYKLRKKLNAYYTSEDVNSAVIFHLEKGQYNLSFLSSKEVKDTNKKENAYIKISKPAFYTFSSLIVLSISIFCLLNSIASTSHSIWQPYFNKNVNNLLVISDQYVVSEKLSDGNWHGVLYPEINNSEDLLKHARQHTNQELHTTDYTLMSKMAPFGVNILTQWFVSQKNNFNLQLESHLSFDDVRENNIIFIGQSKTMNLSSSLFLKDSKLFSVYGDGFKVTKGGEETLYDTKHEAKGRVEYAMVSFNTFSKDKMTLMFVSNNDIGVLATLRNFTNSEWLHEFEKQLPEGSQYFHALFEVQGVQRSDISCKLVELEIISK